MGFWERLWNFLKMVFAEMQKVKEPVKPAEPVIPGPLFGLDVSGWQPKTNWEVAAKQLKVKFAFIKATERTTYVNPVMKKDVPEATAQGIKIGGYHYWKPGFGGVEQADHFVNTLKKNSLLDKGRLFPVLDWEETNSSGDQAAIQDFLNRVEAVTGIKCLIYLSPGFANAQGNPAWLKNYPLWIAHWKVAKPAVPRPWTEYAFWQCDVRQLPELGAEYDCNLFPGSTQDLEKYLIK